MKKLIEKAIVEGIRSQNDAATLLSLYITEIKKEDVSPNDLSILIQLSQQINWSFVLWKLAEKYDIKYVSVFDKYGAFKGNFLYDTSEYN